MCHKHFSNLIRGLQKRNSVKVFLLHAAKIVPEPMMSSLKNQFFEDKKGNSSDLCVIEKLQVGAEVLPVCTMFNYEYYIRVYRYLPIISWCRYWP